MTRVPAPALLLGATGLIPFLFAALVALGVIDNTVPGLSGLNVGDGRLVLARYGVVILCFMSGVLWGFATRASGAQAAAAYALSVIPALWTFLNPGSGAEGVLINLMIGYAGLLVLDFAFQRWELAPPWWMALRIPLSIVVLISLAIGVWA